MEQVRYRRLLWTFWGLLTVLALLTWRLGEIQIKQHVVYATAKVSQNALELALEPIARGLILDRRLHDLNGRYVADRIIVFPQLLEEPDRVALVLSEILAVEADEIRRRMEYPGILPYPVTREQKARILDYDWMGVGAWPVTFRYGERPLAVHTVGHLSAGGKTGSSSGTVAGQSGIELWYESELQGTHPRAVVRAFLDAHGRPLPGLDQVIAAGRANDGRHDIRLTLDWRVQHIVEDIMDREVASGAVVVMEIASGDILAIASRPDYHPGRVGEYLQAGMADTFNNQALSLYQPGSVFKIVVAAAALEEGLVTTGDGFYCSGHRDEFIRCWLPAGHGAIDFPMAFADSCNPTFARLALQLGSGQLVEYAQRFRLDNQAVIGYPVPPDQRQDFSLIGRPFNLVNAGVGQGPVLVTPLQITALVAAIGREGVYINPRLVSEIRQENRAVRIFTPGVPEQIMSSETARQMAEIMELVTTDGQGKAAMVPGWGSAGKTGTAQVGNGADNAWFAGYFPAGEPRYALTVFVRGGGSGGETAAPIFKMIAERMAAVPDL